MNFRQIEAFRAVMLTGSATEAAKMLFITQPAISRLISNLEHSTGIQLFIRKPNRLVPTQEAKTLYLEVDRAFLGLEEIRAAAEAIVNQQQGGLRIVAMPVCAESFLPSLISKFTKLYPKVDIEFAIAPRARALKMIREQLVDIGIVSMVGEDTQGLKTSASFEQQAVCVLPADNPLSHKPQIHVNDLEHEPFISLSTGSPFRSLIDKAFIQAEVARKITIETGTQKSIYELIKRGAGLSILDPFVTNSQDADIVIRPFVPEINWDYVIVQLETIPISLNAKSFIELLIADLPARNAAL